MQNVFTLVEFVKALLRQISLPRRLSLVDVAMVVYWSCGIHSQRGRNIKHPSLKLVHRHGTSRTWHQWYDVTGVAYAAKRMCSGMYHSTGDYLSITAKDAAEPKCGDKKRLDKWIASWLPAPAVSSVAHADGKRAKTANEADVKCDSEDVQLEEGDGVSDEDEFDAHSAAVNVLSRDMLEIDVTHPNLHGCLAIAAQRERIRLSKASGASTSGCDQLLVSYRWEHIDMFDDGVTKLIKTMHANVAPERLLQPSGEPVRSQDATEVALAIAHSTLAYKRFNPSEFVKAYGPPVKYDSEDEFFAACHGVAYRALCEGCVWITNPAYRPQRYWHNRLRACYRQGSRPEQWELFMQREKDSRFPVSYLYGMLASFACDHAVRQQLDYTLTEFLQPARKVFRLLGSLTERAWSTRRLQGVIRMGARLLHMAPTSTMFLLREYTFLWEGTYALGPPGFDSWLDSDYFPPGPGCRRLQNMKSTDPARLNIMPGSVADLPEEFYIAELRADLEQALVMWPAFFSDGECPRPLNIRVLQCICCIPGKYYRIRNKESRGAGPKLYVPLRHELPYFIDVRS